jgi:hypothetical protein
MKFANAEDTFRQFLEQRGKTIDELTPEHGIDAMMEFYRSVRADDCDIDADGDMLLFQWGTFDWGDGGEFELDITRQFIPLEEGAGEISQLSLTFRFEPDSDLDELGKGNAWCHHPNELPEFDRDLRSSDAYLAVCARTDGEVELAQENVE